MVLQGPSDPSVPALPCAPTVIPTEAAPRSSPAQASAPLYQVKWLTGCTLLLENGSVSTAVTKQQQQSLNKCIQGKSDNRGGKCPVIHLTVPAPTRTPQRLLDLVNQHDHAHAQGGTCSHQQPWAGQDRTCGTASRLWAPARTALMGSRSSSAGRDGLCVLASSHFAELVASQSLLSR